MPKNKLNLHIYGIHLLNPYKTVVSHLKQDALANTDGTILFIFPDWYFGALIFSVVNAAAKRRSKFAFDRSQ